MFYRRCWNVKFQHSGCVILKKTVKLIVHLLLLNLMFWFSHVEWERFHRRWEPSALRTRHLNPWREFTLEGQHCNWDTNQSNSNNVSPVLFTQSTYSTQSVCITLLCSNIRHVKFRFGELPPKVQEDPCSMRRTCAH